MEQGKALLLRIVAYTYLLEFITGNAIQILRSAAKLQLHSEPTYRHAELGVPVVFRNYLNA